MKVLGLFKDPWSAITHLAGLILAVIGAFPLLAKAAGGSDGRRSFSCMLVFVLSMIFLYAASTAYHTFDLGERKNRILQKIDHSAISVMIAGTYTPPCLLVIGQPAGRRLCILVWAIAIAGILVKMFWITCPKWFSSVLYIGMGWACLTAFPSLLSDMSRPCFLLFLAGGIFYTVGGILYAMKLEAFNARHKDFGNHEIFHLFVLGGSICHYAAMYFYIA